MRVVFLFLLGGNLYAIGGIEIPYLIEILSENVKRYEQLREVIKQGEDSQELLRALNEGIDNASELLQALPIKNEKALKNLSKFKETRDWVREVYGEIPKNGEEALFKLHDETVSESFKMAALSHGYAQIQEQNAQKVFAQARDASPKGAQRMSAQMNAQILHSLGQLIRINSQMLKLQSEQLASETKRGKDSVKNLNRLAQDMEKSFKHYRPSGKFPRF